MCIEHIRGNSGECNPYHSLSALPIPFAQHPGEVGLVGKKDKCYIC